MLFRSVKVLYFEEPSAAVLTKVEEAVKGIVSLMDGGDARIVRCATMLPLVKRTYGSMMSPLSERGVKPQDEA